MTLKILIIILVALGGIYQTVLNAVKRRSAENPTPDCVADVYDAETYQKWKKYCAENCRLDLASGIATVAISIALLASNAYAAFASLFGDGIFLQLLSVVLLEALIAAVIEVVTTYISTMIIEEKYGFNRSSVKTFVGDRIRSFLINFALSLFLVWLMSVLHRSVGDLLIVIFAVCVFCLTLLISFLYPILSRIGNKFTPLEDGELKERLMELLTKHGYTVKAIEVMDASRRTTKSNAYFTGFGKMKTIVLYDNLVNAMTPDEICAVFAHELGHGLYRDVTKQQIMNFGNLLIMGAVVWLTVREPELHTQFGFDAVNYGFASVLMSAILGIVQPLTGMAMNAYSRYAEFRADRQAVKEGYADAMITALKKLARENFAHLAPSRVNVVLEYSHPPLAERIEAVEREKK